jgi:hypothetical protein
VGLHKPPANGEAQSGPLPDILRSEERLENPVDILGRNALSCIRHTELDEASVSVYRSRFQLLAITKRLVTAHPPRHDAKASAIWHGIEGIGHKIEKHLLELAWIADYRGNVGIERGGNGHAFSG